MFVVPETLARAGLTVRAAGPGDRPFFRTLFATARVDAPILAQWPAPDREAFLDSQFEFQDRHYTAVHAGADFLVLELNGVPAGRLYLDRGPEEWCVVDIAFLPRYRGKGLGAAVLRAVMDAARQAGAPKVALHVETANPARRLYARLGFIETDNGGIHIAMEWRCV